MPPATEIDPLQVRARLTLQQILWIFLLGFGAAGSQFAIYQEQRAIRLHLEAMDAGTMHMDQWSRWETKFRQDNPKLNVPYMHELIRPSGALPVGANGQATY